MGMSLAWWLLVVAGVGLMIGELFIGAFIVLWFGIGAVVAGLLTLAVPEMNLGVQVLLTSVIGVVLMYAFRRRYVAKENAAKEHLSTFSATQGRLHVSDSGQLSVFANGTYWQIANPEVLGDRSRNDGETVTIQTFTNNRAVLGEVDSQSPTTEHP